MKKLINVIIWGGTGQAKVVRPIIESQGAQIVAVFDDTPGLIPPFDDIPLFNGQKDFESWKSKNLGPMGYCIAIGNPHGEARLRLSNYLKGYGLEPYSVIHSSSIIEEGVHLGEGVQVMAGAVIGVNVRIAEQCIINTRVSVDHDSVLEEGVELAPGVTLCGEITVQRCAWIGAGANVLPRITVGEGSIVGAGALVNRDVKKAVVVVGVPALKIKDLNYE